MSVPKYALVVALAAVAAGGTAGADGPPPPDADLDAWDAEMLAAVNAARALGGACGTEVLAPSGPLTWDDRLEVAAARQSRDMAVHGYVGHTNSAGRGTGQRARRAGYRWSVVAENLARYPGDIDDVVRAWLGSPGHCRNILEPTLAEMGAAKVGDHWTQVFGTPR